MGFRDDGETMVLSGGGQRILLTASAFLMLIVGVAMVTLGGDKGAAALGAVTVFLCLWYLVALYRVRVTVGVDHLEVRTPYRLRRLPWRDVTRADVGSAGTLSIFNDLIVTLGSGDTFRVEGVGRLVAFRGGRRTPVEYAAELINRRAGA